MIPSVLDCFLVNVIVVLLLNLVIILLLYWLIWLYRIIFVSIYLKENCRSSCYLPSYMPLDLPIVVTDFFSLTLNVDSICVQYLIYSRNQTERLIFGLRNDCTRLSGTEESERNCSWLKNSGSAVNNRIISQISSTAKVLIDLSNLNSWRYSTLTVLQLYVLSMEDGKIYIFSNKVGYRLFV